LITQIAERQSQQAHKGRVRRRMLKFVVICITHPDAGQIGQGEVWVDALEYRFRHQVFLNEILFVNFRREERPNDPFYADQSVEGGENQQQPLETRRESKVRGGFHVRLHTLVSQVEG